jgi:hypothetical protein
MPPPRPWAAPVSEPALRRYQQEWPVQYHKPITRSGQPRAGGQRRADRLAAWASPSCKPFSPTPPATNYTQPRRRPFILPRPCAGDHEQRVSRPPAGSCSWSAHASLANAPSWPPDQTLRRALYRASPRCSARRCKSAQWLVWLKGTRVAAACRWTGTLLLRIPVAWHKAGILRTSPGLHDVGYYYDQANLASFLHRLVKSSICRANSFYYILILFSLLSFFYSFISSSHIAVSAGNASSLLRVLALVGCTIPQFFYVFSETCMATVVVICWVDKSRRVRKKKDWKLWFGVSLLSALVLRVPGKRIAWADMQTTFNASFSNGTVKFESKRDMRNKNKHNNFMCLSPYESNKAVSTTYAVGWSRNMTNWLM